MAQYTQRTQPMHRSRAPKFVQHTSKKSENLNKVLEPPLPETRNSKLYKLLNEPSTSKATYEQGDKQTISDIELFYENSDIERQVIDIDIEQSVNAHVIKKRKLAQKEHKVSQGICKATQVSQEVQVISDDDDDVVEIKTEYTDTYQITETFPKQTKSGDDNVSNQITDNEIILIDGSSIFRTTISIDTSANDSATSVNDSIDTTVKKEPEDDGDNEEEVILPDVKITINDPLKVELDFVKPEFVKEEPEDEITNLEDGGAGFEDEEVEYDQLKTENPDNTIDIGETVIQATSTSYNLIDDIFSTLVGKKFVTVADKNHLSTIIFDTDCIFNKKCIFNDNIKIFAKELYFCSEEAYKFMANYISCLPPVPQIKATFVTSNGEPGFSKEALNCLKMRVWLKKYSYPIFCSLAINDIELKAPGTREKHKVAFIITVVALNASWKLPICYFIYSDLLNSKKRIQMIHLAVCLVEKCGIIPKAVSYKPTFQNIEMAESLAKYKKNKKTRNKNIMFSPLSGRMIYLIPDPVYTIDKFRICGCVDKDQMFISLRHVELLVKYLGRIRPGKMINRLLGKSLTFSLEVCATDLLSSGLANVEGTVRYLKLINKFLDIMTSHPGGTSWKEAVKLRNMMQVTSFLDFFKKYLSMIFPKYKSNSFWLHNTERGQLKFDTRSIIDVLSMAVQNAEGLIQEIVRGSSNTVIELSMKKLTMNSTAFLANFYHIAGNGEMTEMMVEEFIARYKQNLEYMKPHAAKIGYTLPIENISVLDITSPVQRINVTTYLLNSNNIFKTRQFEIDTRDDLYKILKCDPRGEYSNLSKIYIAGYVVYNLVRRLRCDTCISALLRSNQRQEVEDPYTSELVIQKTEQDSSSKLCVKLMDPSADVVRICKATDAVFKRAMAQSEAEYLDILKHFSIPLLMFKLQKDMIGKDYFKGLDFHRHDTDTLENHVVELAKAVAEVYLQIRLKYRYS